MHPICMNKSRTYKAEYSLFFLIKKALNIRLLSNWRLLKAEIENKHVIPSNHVDM